MYAVPIVPGYSEASRNAHWACNADNPNCPTGEHVRRYVSSRWEEAQVFTGALVIIVVALVFAVLPIFI